MRWLKRDKGKTGIVIVGQALQDPATLKDAGIAAMQQYGASGQVANLNRALECWHEALKLIPPDSPDRSTYLHYLGFGLYERYTRSGSPADLEAAIRAFQRAVQTIPLDSPDRPMCLSNLGTGLRERYAYSQNLTDLEAAISTFQQAVQATPDASHRPERLSNLGLALRVRYLHTGAVENLEAAINVFQEAVQTTPPNSQDRPMCLNNLGAGLRDRYTRSGNLTDLEAAISAVQQAVQTAPPDFPHRPMYLSNLGLMLREQYAHSQNLTDLEAAISTFQRAVQATSSDSPDRPIDLHYLGLMLRERYRRSQFLADLEAAIGAFQRAVQTAPPDFPHRPAYLNNLGLVLRERYARSGSLADLEAAISTFQQAVQATPSDSPDRLRYLSNLGIELNDRYTRSQNLADLEAAISTFQQAVQATPLDSPDRSGYLNNLSIGLRERYTRSGNLADLEIAFSAIQQAVQATPFDSPDRLRYLSNLGIGLNDQYRHSGNPADLEAAIGTFQQAVQATPSDSPDRPKHLLNLGAALHDRYAYSQNLTDLEAAINAFQQAVQATPSDSPDRIIQLSKLGAALHDRYAHSQNLADLEAAISAWEKAWSISHPRFAVLPVTYQLGQQYMGAGIAVHLVPAYLELAKLSDLRSPSIPRRALEIAEGSKSRLLTQLIGRGPLPLPSGLTQDLAEQELQFLINLTALDAQELAIHDHFASSQEETSHLHSLQQRQAALIGLEELWAHIARLGPEGTAYVTLRRGAALAWQELSDLAKQLGPATMLLSFFTTTDRALLFLLRAGWHTPHVFEEPLDRNSWADIMDRFFREVHYYDPGLRLNETWDYPLHPLLTKVQRHLKGVERLILAPAGNGHLLPWTILAERTGWHRAAGQLLPLVTLPALSILPRLRKRQPVPPGPALVVGDPRGDLHHAEHEAREVAKRFETEPLLGAAATKSEVLARLPGARLIHLATHAFFEPKNPLESGIELADGVLTAREVFQHHLQADLLVLSACESGRVGSLGGEELAGLSQAFLQAGVRSLLVSLWEVDDPATAALMQAFYTQWQERGADKALALRQAMTQIQQDPQNPYWSDPYYWGAFVLIGDWELTVENSMDKGEDRCG
jgi:tetratricopeptide (TPR) repeat protein